MFRGNSAGTMDEFMFLRDTYSEIVDFVTDTGAASEAGYSVIKDGWESGRYYDRGTYYSPGYFLPGRPGEYSEGNGPAEQWRRGGYGAVFPAGTWVTCGQALREPVGRIHWAGTETAEAFVGYIDGAVRSGERVVNEVLEVLE